MNVDYRLLSHFEASRVRHEAVRRALPAQWRSDPRPEIQRTNELWVSVVVRARELQGLLTAGSSSRAPVVLLPRGLEPRS
jgi:hypothetical protein